MTKTFLVFVCLILNYHGVITSPLTVNPTVVVEDVIFIKLGTYRGFTDEGTEYQKSYFLSRYAKAPWAESQAICNAYKMELTTIETLQESRSFLRMLDADPNLRPLSYSWNWIDGITLSERSATDWYWTKTGRKISIPIDWYPGHPSGNQFCLGVSKLTLNANFGFNDGTCPNAVSFICQRIDFFLSKIVS